MASNVVSVFVRADSSQLTAAFDKTISAGERFKAKMSLVGQAVVAALAVKAVTAAKDFAVDSIRAFTDLNESLNALEVTYGEHADGIKKLGEEAAQNLGLSNSAFNTFAVSISAFAQQIAGDGGDVVGVVDELTTRVSDFASVMNLEVNEAARLFQSGLAGETEPLRRYGIDLSAAAVKAHALAAGISDGSGELTEQEKILARHSLLMKQTDKTAGDFVNTSDELANSERIVNAELENQKALLGEILSPLKSASLEMQRGFIKSLGDAAIALGGMTGALSDGEAALLSFKNETGESAEKIADVIEGVDLAWQSWTHEIDVWIDTLGLGNRRTEDLIEGIQELIKEQDLAGQSILDMKEELLELLYSGELTQDEFHDLSETLDLEFSKSMAEARGEMQTTIPISGKLAKATEDLAEEEEDLAVEIQSVTDALKDQASQLRSQIDPVFGYLSATRDLADAQIAYNEAVEEFGEDSPEAIAAAEDIAEANLGIRDAVIAIGEDGVSAAMEALKSMGVPPAVITRFAADKRRIEEIFRNLTFRIGVTAPTLYPTKPSSGGVGWISDSNTYYAHGGLALNGPAPTGTFGEAGAEAIVPLEDQRGIKFMAAALKEAGLGGPNLVFPGNVYGLDDLEQRVLEMIERARRRGIAV